MLDSSSAGYFSKKSIEFKWDLIERIKRNSEYWETDKGNKLGTSLEFDCIKSCLERNVFHKLSAKYESGMSLEFDCVRSCL